MGKRLRDIDWERLDDVGDRLLLVIAGAVLLGLLLGAFR